MNEKIWGLEADIFLPCAASKLVTREQLDRLISGGLELISCGANVPFRDEEIFYGPVYEYADQKVSVLPDFIANCGMARAFAYLMQSDIDISDEGIFGDVSDTIYQALARCARHSPSRQEIAKTAFELSLQSLVNYER